MVSLILFLLGLGILAAELALGMVFVGLQGNDFVIERSKRPGQYWLAMALHVAIGVGLPLLAVAAGL